MTGDLTALLGGAAARSFRRRRPTFSINSLGCLFGNGADGRQVDLCVQFIELVETLGIAFDVMPVGAARRA